MDFKGFMVRRGILALSGGWADVWLSGVGPAQERCSLPNARPRRHRYRHRAQS